MTSHDVVDHCRKAFGLRRVGHAGTLDPAAAGVLVLCLGTATRIAGYLSESDKRYRAEIWLGIASDTHDAEGEVTACRPVEDLSLDRVREALARFLGTQEQVPPRVSAVRQGGRRAYERHRRGEEVELAPRAVTIYALEVVDWRPGPWPRLLLDVHCSKGTYIRALARDLGEALGCGAVLGALVRTAAGPFTLERARTLEELDRAAREGRAAELLIDPAEALSFLPAWRLSPADARRVRHGAPPAPRGAGRGGAATAGEQARGRLLEPRGHTLAGAPLGNRAGKLVARPEMVITPS
ncbi:MAG: tRNA pseudouridine(55) synthase TruB [Bacillota bacterium]|nr:MAG: tRNA pseudouridine(55) synthase TruB [Bacillota bacterium]